MRDHALTLLLNYAIAGAAVVLVLPIALLLATLEEAPFSLFLAAVMVGAWYGGLGPGLLATGLSILALDYFFLPPVYALGTGWTDAFRLGTFTLVAAIIGLLNARQRRLEEALRQQNRSKERFIAVLVHELRNPVAAILYALEVLRARGTAPSALEQSRDIIERQVRKVTRLLEDLMESARASLGKIQLSKKLIDLRQVASEAVESTRPQIVAPGHRLEVALPAEPLWVEGDGNRLHQVIVNLLSNAAKYTEPGGRIWLTLDRSHGWARLRVKDTGVGLAPETLPHVFDLFAQPEGSSRGGLGVGLSLARELVQLHGGTLTANSEGRGCGSEFTMSLVLATQPQGEIRQKACSSTILMAGGGTGADAGRQGFEAG